jgi:hypothetical protein
MAVAAHFAKKGVFVERLNLRVPSFENLRLSSIIEATRGALGGDRDRAVLFGSSLGGLAACRVAESDARVFALVLLAPALGIATRWRTRQGGESWRAWEQTGWLETFDFAEGKMGRVDFGFGLDVEALEKKGDPDVRVPTLILHGRRDETVDIDLSRAWAAGKRHVKLVELDDGHELTASIPRILREAEAFLAPLLNPA